MIGIMIKIARMIPGIGEDFKREMDKMETKVKLEKTQKAGNYTPSSGLGI
jgi:hypothetical protein